MSAATALLPPNLVGEALRPADYQALEARWISRDVGITRKWNAALGGWSKKKDASRHRGAAKQIEKLSVAPKNVVRLHGRFANSSKAGGKTKGRQSSCSARPELFWKCSCPV